MSTVSKQVDSLLNKLLWVNLNHFLLEVLQPKLNDVVEVTNVEVQLNDAILNTFKCLNLPNLRLYQFFTSSLVRVFGYDGLQLLYLFVQFS